MDVFLLTALGAVFAYIMSQSNSWAAQGAAAAAPTAGVPFSGIPSDAAVKAAIQRGIVDPLGLDAGATNILFAQYILETNHGRAPYYPITRSMFNRHIGSGRGEWKGSGKSHSELLNGTDYFYVSPGDPDLRCFLNEDQCARDMAQLLQDPLYVNALAGLQRGSAPDYFNALTAAGFSTDTSYAVNLQGVYDALA